MLEEVLRHLKNWFLMPDGVHTGRFAVEEGTLALPFLEEGQFFRICGSRFNDGLYRYPASGLREETFAGAVWVLGVPEAVTELAEEIGAWCEKHGGAPGPYQSESFGGYSYTRAADGAAGGPLTWQGAFRSRLAPYRRLREV